MRSFRRRARRRSRPGMTLLEMTVVILVLLSLVSVLMLGGRAWKYGSDRSGCIMNIRNAQLGVRSFQNLNGLETGTSFNMLTEVMGAGGFLTDPSCPAGAAYAYISYIPDYGELALTCSLAASRDHKPPDVTGW